MLFSIFDVVGLFVIVWWKFIGVGVVDSGGWLLCWFGLLLVGL